MERTNKKQPKLRIRRGDLVRVIAGDDRGKEGRVLEVNLQKSRIVVEGVNIITKHQKPSAGKPNGELKKTEAGVHVSNLALIDPANGKTTRVGRKLNEQGSLQRYSKKTGEFIK
jgi:large subunit ribosomal protein L24